MHYVYGRIRLAVKSILKDKFDESEMEKFTGCYEPYLWLPKNVRLIDSFISHKEVKPYYINRLIENIVISCIITHYNLVKFGGYVINRIDIKNVQEDIQTIIFDDIESIYGNGTDDKSIKTIYNVCMKWKKNFLNRYIRLYHEFNLHWHDGNPDEWITSRFEHGYFYKKRAKRHEKPDSKRTDWSWLDNKNSEEIAREIIRRGMHHTRKLELAFQKRHISMTVIKSEITRINEEDKNFVIDCAIKKWFETMDCDTKERFIIDYEHVLDKEMTADTFRYLCINAYHYDTQWFQFFNCVNLEPIRSTLEGLSAQTTSNSAKRSIN
jgi:hypothetical protein